MAVKGLKKVKMNFSKITGDIEEAVKEGLTDATLDLERRSKEEAPVDTGDLRGSGYSEVKKDYAGYHGIVGFNTAYALIQHEDMTFVHPQGGKAKYLTDPLNRNATKYRKMIQEKARRVTK
jgi:hypothetical protein